MTQLIQLTVTFVSVFFRGFQHQNVIGGKYKSAFFTSYVLAIGEVVTVILITRNGFESVIPVGTGAALGITFSMWFYRRIHK